MRHKARKSVYELSEMHEQLKKLSETYAGEIQTYKDRYEEILKDKNDAFELLAQCTLRRNASEMRIEDLKGQLYTQKEDLETAVRLLQTCVHDNLPINEAIEFVQAYWNKHNIFPYEP